MANGNNVRNWGKLKQKKNETQITLKKSKWKHWQDKKLGCKNVTKRFCEKSVA